MGEVPAGPRCTGGLEDGQVLGKRHGSISRNGGLDCTPWLAVPNLKPWRNPDRSFRGWPPFKPHQPCPTLLTPTRHRGHPLAQEAPGIPAEGLSLVLAYAKSVCHLCARLCATQRRLALLPANQASTPAPGQRRKNRWDCEAFVGKPQERDLTREGFEPSTHGLKVRCSTS